MNKNWPKNPPRKIPSNEPLPGTPKYDQLANIIVLQYFDTVNEQFNKEDALLIKLAVDKIGATKFFTLQKVEPVLELDFLRDPTIDNEEKLQRILTFLNEYV